jgi:GT2 family glycosyltransferase
MTHKIAIVVATKDRPADVRRLLESLRQQAVPPAEIVIVDASREPVESMVTAFPELRTRYIRHLPPSAAAQRNAGIRACDPTATLIGFVDDDTTFEPEAFANMLRFWEEAGPDVLGAAFNMRNYPSRGRQSLKRSRLAESLGLYSPRAGSVSLSGWHTVIGALAETQFVDWIGSCAALWRREVFAEDLFDEFYEGANLEDLDFSYTVGRRGRLAVVADAGFSHFPSAGGRLSSRPFGRLEVRNRVYFVKKHHLSIARCYLGLAIRFAMSLWNAVVRWDATSLARAFGNLEAVVAPRAIPARPQSSPAPPCRNELGSETGK